MKITVYTITDCKFSQAEKTYLQGKNLQFEEKNLETNREFLTEMLSVSNNFAGTPVTKIEKDDGQVIVLKGFTQDEFDKALGAPTANTAAVAETPTPAPAVAQPSIPVAAPVYQPAPVVEQPVAPPMPQQPMVQQPVIQEPVMPNPVMPPTMPAQQPMQPMGMAMPQEPPMAPMSQPTQEPQIPVYQPKQTPSMQTPSEEALSSVLQDLQAKVANEKPQM